MATVLLSVPLVAILSFTLSSVVSTTIILSIELSHMSAEEVLPIVALLTGISLVLTVLHFLLIALEVFLFLLVRLLLEQEVSTAE